MFRRITNSWELTKASAGVLRADQELIVFPIVSATAMVLVTITFALPLLLASTLDAMLAGGTTVLGAVVAFLFYLVQYTVMIFFNSALVGAALIRLRGGNPTIGDGLRVASRHVGSIIGYAALSATLGVILRAIASRTGTLGRIVASLVGLGWNLATYLVVPVLVVEGLGPLDAIKRSAALLKQTWGEQIAGSVGIGLLFGLAGVLVAVLGIAGIVLGVMTQFVVLAMAAAAIMILVLLFLALLGSTLGAIYTAALYRYAVTGETSGFFGRELIAQAFTTR
jgi:hypothetical protein